MNLTSSRLAIALIAVGFVVPASAESDRYSIEALLISQGALLASFTSTIAAEEEVSFSRSGEQAISASFQLHGDSEGNLCAGLVAELSGDWGKGNSSAACRAIQIGEWLEFPVVEEAVLRVRLAPKQSTAAAPPN